MISHGYVSSLVIVHADWDTNMALVTKSAIRWGMLLSPGWGNLWPYMGKGFGPGWGIIMALDGEYFWPSTHQRRQRDHADVSPRSVHWTWQQRVEVLFI